jgi:hypothetical protein
MVRPDPYGPRMLVLETLLIGLAQDSPEDTAVGVWL